MGSHFINYVDFKMTLTLTLRSRLRADSLLGPYNYYLHYFPVESFFWLSVVCIVENRKIDFEMPSSSPMSQLFI